MSMTLSIVLSTISTVVFTAIYFLNNAGGGY
jgi:hypothetical protein